MVLPSPGIGIGIGIGIGDGAVIGLGPILGGIGGLIYPSPVGEGSDIPPPMQMPAPGNVADTQVVGDYNEAASNARQCGENAPDRCAWLEQNKNNYRPDQVKATQKAWGCRRSRQGR